MFVILTNMNATCQKQDHQFLLENHQGSSVNPSVVSSPQIVISEKEYMSLKCEVGYRLSMHKKARNRILIKKMATIQRTKEQEALTTEASSQSLKDMVTQHDQISPALRNPPISLKPQNVKSENSGLQLARHKNRVVAGNFGLVLDVRARRGPNTLAFTLNCFNLRGAYCGQMYGPNPAVIGFKYISNL